jgi:hypothetical protein
MKTILIFAAAIFSTTAFSQISISNTTKQNIDNNGIQLKNTPVQLIAEYFSASVMTVYAYDTVRPLAEINNPTNADAYPWISPDGLRLYYTSGANADGLMFTQRANTSSYFDSPTLVPISISSPSSYWLSSDELDVYICTFNELFYAHRNTVSSSFNTPVLINLTGIPSSSIKGASLNTAQNVLFVCVFSTPSKIVEFARTSSTSFNYVRTLPVPSGYIAHPGQLSKDELTFFFSASYNVGNDLLYQLTRTSPTDSFTISTFQQIQGINDTSMLVNGQPSMSDGLNWVAFMRCGTMNWTANDLFIANKGPITSVFNPSEEQISISVFPNPSSGKFTIQMENAKGKNADSMIEIYNVFGEKVFRQQISKNIDVSYSPKGIYFIKIYDGVKIYTRKVVIQ